MAHINDYDDKDGENAHIMDNESDDKDGDRDEDNDEILKEARHRFDLAVTAESQNAIEALEDDNFMAGRDHWPDEVKREREAEGRPCLTINKLVQFKNQVFNPIRSNTPNIKIRATASSPHGEFTANNGTQYSQAEVLGGLIKNIETQSKAVKSYNHATSQAIDGGWGYFRAVSEYIDGSFDQEIRIKRIKNRFAVKIDPSSTESDRSDIKWAFISEWMPVDEFKKKYPNASRNDLDTVIGESLEKWYEDGAVRIAEYYRIVKKDIELALLSDGRVIELNDKTNKVVDELKSVGITIQNKRKAKKNVVEWRKITGNTILEDVKIIPCKYIPISIVIGIERIVDGEVILEGLVRQAKDSVRQYNYWRTAEIESVALQPKQPFIVGASQIGQYKTQWERANKDNSSVLIFDDAQNPNPPNRQTPPLASSGNLNAAKAASDDIKSTMGMFDPSIDTRAKEKSGKAIIAQDAQMANGNFHYSDNQAEAIEHMARILVDMIPKVYDGNRVVRVIMQDGSEADIELFQQIQDEQTGEIIQINDLSFGTFEVEVDVGPSYLTKRLETVDGLMQFFQAIPRSAEIAADLLAKNLDMPEADELQRRMRLTAPPGMIEYPQGEEPPPPQPTPQDQAEMKKAEAMIATAQATEAKAAAVMAESDLKMAQIQQGGTQGEQSLTPEQVTQIVDERVKAGIMELIQLNQG